MEKQTVQNSSNYQAIVNDWIGNTNYINDVIALDDMVEMFVNNFHFGEAETQVILASLIMCGAKFKK